MSVEFKEVRNESSGFVAQERLWLSADGKILHDGDHRAAMLLAPKGGVIPAKLAARLGLAKGIKVEALEKLAPKPKTIAPEEIESRSTRPENPSGKR